MPDDCLTQIRAYHQRSKHAPDRYAPGPGQMDWATQPDPFRRFAGAPECQLPLAADQREKVFSDLFTVPGGSPEPLCLESLAVLLELSFALSAWKVWGKDRWALRCNPSSGNLHPTECYLAVSGVAGIADGIHHYASRDHLLEHRCAVKLPFAGVLVGLSSIHWREAWKYGERAYRYCQLDTGHGLAGLRYAAAVLNWRVRLLDDWSDGDLAAVLGLSRNQDFAMAEREEADLVCLVGPDTAGPVPAAQIAAAAAAGSWQGTANVLSASHRHQWPVIDEVSAAASKPCTDLRTMSKQAWGEPLRSKAEHRAATLIRQRRSAQAFDGLTSTDCATLWRLLDATLPRHDCPPLDAWPHPPRVHLLLFIHRVDGLEPGVYLFCRVPGAVEAIRPRMHRDFLWTEVVGPGPLRLQRLIAGDCRQVAAALACQQEIAGSGVLCMAMLAEFDQALADGGWWYRRLFWECGMIGQVAYLEAEAVGLRATGIGCFFDDAVHALCGLEGSALQSLYHCTIGRPLEDRRVLTLPPYSHLAAARVLREKYC